MPCGGHARRAASPAAGALSPGDALGADDADDSAGATTGERMSEKDKDASRRLLQEGMRQGLGDASPTNKKQWS